MSEYEGKYLLDARWDQLTVGDEDALKGLSVAGSEFAHSASRMLAERQVVGSVVSSELVIHLSQGHFTEQHETTAVVLGKAVVG